MKPTIYLETSIIGYRASRPSRDLITAANQQLTHEWWDHHLADYDAYVSTAVIDECSAGDKIAAQERMALLVGIPEIAITQPATKLAQALMRIIPLPPKANMDALHVAIAAANGLDFLLTWNCTHIANASFRRRIVEACEAKGFAAPTICTPQELMES